MKNKVQNLKSQLPSQMQNLTTDMRELRIIYEWTDIDVAEIKRAARDNPEWWDWWRKLAAAYREGYRQTPENNWMRLTEWTSQFQESEAA